MEVKSGTLVEWLMPLAFIFCAGWVTWHMPAFILDWGEDGQQLSEQFKRLDVTPNMPAIMGKYIDIVDILALLGTLVFAVLGIMTVRRAPIEFERWRKLDKVAVFIGRVTMLLVVLLTSVMLYEVFVRYLLNAGTLWANELSLWLAGFVFLCAGLYAMQQRSHIRIFILYDVLPRWMQHVCDIIWVALLWFFAACLVFGSYKQVFINKFYKWQTFGTAFDPPIPATIQPTILIVICLIAMQALLNLIADWNRDPSDLMEKDIVDKEELEALKKSVGAN